MRSQNLLDDFTRYCQEHPQQRFWQALRNWSEASFIMHVKEVRLPVSEDTFHWEGRTGFRPEKQEA